MHAYYSLLCSHLLSNGRAVFTHFFPFSPDKPFSSFVDRTIFVTSGTVSGNTATLHHRSSRRRTHRFTSREPPRHDIKSTKNTSFRNPPKCPKLEERDEVRPVQSGGCPVHVPLVVQWRVVRPEVLKPSQQAYATELPKVMPSLSTILPCAGVPGFPHDTAGGKREEEEGINNNGGGGGGRAAA